MVVNKFKKILSECGIRMELEKDDCGSSEATCSGVRLMRFKDQCSVLDICYVLALGRILL